MSKPSICFVGLENLPVLAREYGRFRIGGAQVQQTLLAKALVEHGYRVSMVVADYGQRDGESWQGIRTYKAYAAEAGIPVFRFFHPRWTGLWAAARRANADIYYLSCAGVHLGQMALFAQRHRRKLVFRIASDDDCDPRKLPMVRYWRDRKLYAYGLRRADKILAQTPAQQEALRRNYHVDSMLASSLVERGDGGRSFAERDLSVLWVGGLYALKRPNLLLEIARELPDLDFHMVGGAGNGAAAIAYHREIIAAAAGISNLHLTGLVPYHDVQDYFERAKLLVNTTETEGFPNTYLQAWTRGVPVVGYFDPDGIIAREDVGRVVGSADEMRSAIKELTSDPAKWSVMSARCKKFAQRRVEEGRLLEPYLAALSQA